LTSSKITRSIVKKNPKEKLRRKKKEIKEWGTRKRKKKKERRRASVKLHKLSQIKMFAYPFVVCQSVVLIEARF
jgi:hypothetical protein